MAGELVSLPLAAGPRPWIAWFWSELEHDFTPHFGSSSIISTSVLCWCISLCHTHFWGCLCSSLRVFSTACCWMYVHDVKLSHLFVVYKISGCVMCFCLSYDCNVLAWKKQVFLWNIKFYTEKFKICTLYTEMHSVLLVCLVFTWAHLMTCTEICPCWSNTHLLKKITLLLLSVVLSALCHRKRWLTWIVSFYFIFF